MKRTIIIIAAVLLVGIGIFFLVRGLNKQESPIDLDQYTPIPEFRPAAEAIEAQGSDDYDIEETVRILNGLEVAQSQSDNFYSFLEYMAKQDYSRVPSDVLRAKERILPILQKMFELQKQYDELNDIWMLARSASTGVTDFAEKANPIGVLSSIFAGDPMSTAGVNQTLVEAKTAAFQQYENDQKLKESLKKEIEDLHLAYIDYLTEYAPIYIKYMKEWDRLCLDRDKAYLDIYAGRTVEAYNAVDKVLERHPANREAMLLKALTLIQLTPTNPNLSDFNSQLSTAETDTAALRPDDDHLQEAEAIISNYTDLYPDRTAPSLVLKGMIYLKQGNEAKAMSCFDQASVEYPRQAAALTDMLDSYRNRTYLNRSSEGKYLLHLYRSTMEGYGMFSPNLLKAKYYADNGDAERAKEEIFNHFYRRGNQGVYDCLLSDMQYCEQNMYSTFKQLLIEQSYIDVDVEPTTDWIVSKNDDEVKVTIHNRSDIDLENVRIFLCLHYTDMYRDEYDVVKCPSVNIIKHHDTTEIGTVALNYEDKKYNDITRIRAIAMTDDKICWIDNVDYKYMHAYEASRNQSDAAKKSVVTTDKNRREQLLHDFNVTASDIISAVKSGIKVYGKDKTLWDNVTDLLPGTENTLTFELPRLLSLIDPVFSLNQLKDKEHAIRPTENTLNGSNIRLRFDYQPAEGDRFPLYIYSDYINLKVTVQMNKGKLSIDGVEIVD